MIAVAEGGTTVVRIVSIVIVVRMSVAETMGDCCTVRDVRVDVVGVEDVLRSIRSRIGTEGCEETGVNEDVKVVDCKERNGWQRGVRGGGRQRPVKVTEIDLPVACIFS